MMDETKELVRRARQFMSALHRGGVSSEQAAYDGYKLILAMIENDMKQSENMEAAAYWFEQAAKQAGLQRDVMMVETRAER